MVSFQICENNPGALTFLKQAYNMNAGFAEIAFGIAQRNGIKGDKLYMLWNDCCNRDTAKALDVLIRNPIEDVIKHINYDNGRGIPYEQ